MDVSLWIAAGALAAMFLGAGTMKLVRPKDDLVAAGQGWAEDFSQPVVRLIGALEVSAALGLVLPALLDVSTALVPTAALGLVLLMLGAAATHLRRRETPNAALTLVLATVAAVVAWGRLGPYPL